ncbi:hypothetical protein [Streptomyces sp. NPDC052015]|uniref:RICIN domain-containing protein n=1 Tax=Streptomyces sp. NPDC052015 TaxID=3154755 RepID=UPI0034274238
MGAGPDPRAAQTPAEFVATMRQLRKWADLSYRQLERRATDAGDALPRATLSSALAREDLPREELLTAFVRACGGDAATVDTWLEARRQLAMTAEPAAPIPDSSHGAAPTPPAEEPETGSGGESGPSAPPDTVATEVGTDVPADSKDRVTDADKAAATSHAASPPPPEPGGSSRSRYLPMTLTGALAAAGVLLFAFWPDGTTPDTTLPSDGPRTTAGPADSKQPSPTPPSTTPSAQSPSPASPSATGKATTQPNPEPTTQPTQTPSKAPTTPAPATMPKAGWIQMHPAGSSSLCITEGRERNGRTDREIAVQRPCAEAPQPRVYLESLGNSIYRIQWHHPEFGKGCLGVDEALVEGSELMSPGDCTDALGLRYRFEPSGSGYRLRPLDSGLCIGILPPRTSGAEAIQAECTGATDQIFRFSPL